MFTIININSNREYDNKAMISTYDILEFDLSNKTKLFDKIYKCITKQFKNRYVNIIVNDIIFTTYLKVNITAYSS